MPRDLPISNGNLMINFDHEYNIRDVYWPHVGQDNQTVGDVSFFGVWCDGKFAWIGDKAWIKTLEYDDDSLVTRVVARAPSLDLEMTISDTIDFDRDLFLRRVEIKNLRSAPRRVKLYIHFDPHLSGNAIGDTIFFDPEFNGLVAYKGPRYVLLNGQIDDQFGFQSFAIGSKEREGFQGTWRDAEDGNLQQNSIAQGSVDATGMLEYKLAPSATQVAWIWWAFGKTYREVASLDAMVRERGPASFLFRTRDYWKLWVRTPVDVTRLPENVQRLYRRSLLIIRTQVDNSGAVIAATDSDIVQFGKDTYTYMWPRDGAIVTVALIQAGYAEITRRFFHFCSRLLTPEGFLLHKYNPDGSVGSSWHPWMSADGKRQLPIQEDETALVLWALWAHFERFHDVEFVKPLYKPLIKTMADFLARYREPHTRLPAASYDLWEERRGIAAFTIGAVWAGLTAAAQFTDAFGESRLSEKYRKAAQEIRDATERVLFDQKLGRFVRMVNVTREGEIVCDSTIDSSIAGLYLFGMFDPDDPKIVSTMEQIISRLTVKTNVGGMARYENDYYFQVSKDLQNVAGNPWVLCTLSAALWHARRARSVSDLKQAIDTLTWATERALPSGVLPEQLDPYTGAPLSVCPLTWSHASFVLAVHQVADRLNHFVEAERLQQEVRV
ncbi:MAG TPA: glycoside hydrolase family 15 protein [Thermoanaerobaculia bacterium]|nr:glycoside hydrolase family 15 protein [Thermoanaerobaculia bacterium]